MTLYLIGLGLSDEKDISVKGLERVRQADKVYLETFTSFLQCSIKQLSEYYKKEVLPADRWFVEESDTLLKEAKNQKIALLVAGDPLLATTHIELIKEAREQGIEVEIIHNASIFSAIALTGLQLYKFGKTVSIPHQENIASYYDWIT